VYRGEVSIDQVDDFFSGGIMLGWKKLKNYILTVREQNELMPNGSIGWPNNLKNEYPLPRRCLLTKLITTAALNADTTGSNNTAIGQQALFTNTMGFYNAGTGIGALFSNTTGYNNSANGAFSLYYNTTGFENTAQGNNSLLHNTTGTANSTQGSDALASGSDNCATGANALFSNTTGNFNTSTGYNALAGISTGVENTGVGFQVMNNLSIGSNNTAIGVSSGPSSGALMNTVAIGHSTSVAADNQVRIGNAGITSIGGFAAWTNLSDGRYKKDIQEDVKGMEFIEKLKPVTYSIDYEKLDAKYYQSLPAEQKQTLLHNDLNKPVIRQSGFIAQEVESAFTETGFSFNGVDAPENENGLYGLRYSEFVVSLVKAVQEQQVLIESMRATITELHTEVSKLKNRAD